MPVRIGLRNREQRDAALEAFDDCYDEKMKMRNDLNEKATKERMQMTMKY
jgi:hypothetical protein